MIDHPHPYRAFSADGHQAEWVHWESATVEQLTLRWENEAWTASGIIGDENAEHGYLGHDDIQYVMRISPTWQVRQFLLFRDMEEPDLWLGTDSHGRWGEMNGEHRRDLDGCIDVDLLCTPFTSTLPIRRLPLHIGDSAEISVARIDVETLGIVPVRQRYTRVDQHLWDFDDLDSGTSHQFEVDEFGLLRDYPTRFRRVG